MNNVSKYVGKQIKKFRLAKGLTQKELGIIIGVKHNTISSYESGTNDPDQNILFAIAKALDISIDDLFPSITKPARKADKELTAKEDGNIYNVSNLVMLPIVGNISCGNGSFAYENIEGYEPMPKEWLNSGEYFFLRAKGDSMIGARINEGDLLLIRKQPVVENGEIAAVLIDDEAVLKRVYYNGNQVILQSENPKYPPILTTEAKIIGKLKMNVIKY